MNVLNRIMHLVGLFVRFPKIFKYRFYTKVHLVGAELFHTDGQTGQPTYRQTW